MELVILPVITIAIVITWWRDRTLLGAALQREAEAAALGRSLHGFEQGLHAGVEILGVQAGLGVGGAGEGAGALEQANGFIRLTQRGLHARRRVQAGWRPASRASMEPSSA